ncbi:MAG: hypothetical protein V4556_07405 [Bacteroidota bacterium]
MNNKKSKYIIRTAIVLFIIFYIGHLIFTIYQFKVNGRYTIGTIVSIKTKTVGLGKQKAVLVSYNFKNKKYQYEMDGDLGYKIGSRFFIKISPTGNGFGMGIKCEVPDNINIAPAHGWDKKWMQENYPDCSLIK